MISFYQNQDIVAQAPRHQVSWKMAQKSNVTCLSVKKADCASRAGMIEVLQSLAAYCPMDPKGWHPPLVSPTAGAAQSVMVAGDYGFVEMG